MATKTSKSTKTTKSAPAKSASARARVSTASNDAASYTVPGVPVAKGHEVATALQERLHALNDLQLTLKHAHWNVVGPGFIGVHEMLDPQIEEVRAAVDVLAERMATLGVAPNGLPGAIVRERSWDDYDIHRAGTQAHIAALDLVYSGVIEGHRDAIEAVGEIDPVTEDILIAQTGALELFQWFLRAHLEDADGEIASGGASSERGAAKQAERTAPSSR